MAKVRVYISDKLNKQMDELKLNWDAIAQAAFEDKLRELEAKKLRKP